MRKVLTPAVLLLWTVLLSCNGLIVATAYYAEWAAPPLARGTGRPFIEKDYYIRDPLLGWRLQPDLEVVLLDEDSGEHVPYFATTADGVRSTPGQGDGPEVILLGDSYAMGYFLYDRETVAARLAARAGARVVNGGVGGYSTDQEFILLQELLRAHDPAWVVVLFFVNDLLFLDRDRAWDMDKPFFQVVDGTVDFSEVYFSSSAPNNALRERYASQGEVFCCVYDFWNKVGDNIARTYGALLSPGAAVAELQRQISRTKSGQYHYDFDDHLDFYTDPGRYAPAWGLFFQFLEQLHRQGQARGFRLLTLYVPEISQAVHPERDHFAPQRYFMEECGRRGLDCLDPHREFVERQTETALFFMDDGHFAPAGADMTAEIIARRLGAISPP